MVAGFTGALSGKGGGSEAGDPPPNACLSQFNMINKRYSLKVTR